MTDGARSVTVAELAKHHASAGSSWLAIGGEVYDVTEFALDHPGGEDILLQYAGTDATDIFEDVGHSAAARRWLDELHIGRSFLELAETDAPTAVIAPSVATAAQVEKKEAMEPAAMQGKAKKTAALLVAEDKDAMDW